MMIGAELDLVAFGLLASASWGISDFSGGLAARRLSAVNVAAVAYLVGLAVITGAALVSGEMPPPTGDFVRGALAGVVGALGLSAFYHALASGRMGLAAPVSAILVAAVPVIVGIAASGLPGTLQLVGFGLGAVALWLVSYTGAALLTLADLRWPLLAGLGMGSFLAIIAQTESGSVFWTLVAARATSVLTMFIILSRGMGSGWQGSRPVWMAAILAGVLDAAGNVFFMLAEQSGRLDAAAVLSSLYPAMTVLLAWLILKERLTRTHIIGLVMAIAAAACITVG